MNFTSILIIVVVMISIIFCFGILYYIGSVANSVYSIRVKLKEEVDAKLGEHSDHVETTINSQVKWIQGEVAKEITELAKIIQDNIDEEQEYVNYSLVN